MPGPANSLNITEAGYQSFDGISVFHGRTFQAGTGITISNPDGIAGNSTIASTAALTDLHVARFIVASSTAGTGANFTTITSAIASAVGTGINSTIFIQPGTYTENFTLPTNINLCAFTCDSLTPNVTIIGTITKTTAGTSSISGIRLQTNSAALLAVTGSAASIVNLNDCYLNCTNATGITLSSSGGAQVNIKNCLGDIGTTGISLFTINNTGALTIVNTRITNTGSSTTSSTNSAGLITYSFCDFLFPTTLSSTGNLGMGYTSIDTSSQNTTPITLGGNVQSAKSCSFVSGSASAVSIGSSAKLENCFINSTNTNAITGAGTLSYPGLLFDGTSSLINTTTQVLNKQLLGSRQVVLPAGDYTVINSDYFVGATTSGARAITLSATPAIGQIHIIKDITPNATTFNITISGNGNNILGQTSASTYVISVNGGSVTLVYNGVVWCVV